MSENIDITFNEQVLIHAFSRLVDPRVKGRCAHRLINIIFITVCAILCGAKHWNEIAEFGRARIEWLKKILPSLQSIPSHQTFCRVFSLIPAEELLACLTEWSISTTPLMPNDIISVDGKTLRKSGNKSKNRNPLHLINAYVSNRGILIGAIKTPDKSNEIKGIPPLLKSLSISGCIVTIDAMGTQKGIANLIRLRGAQYVLALKKNHKRFYKRVSTLFSKAKQLDYKSMVYKDSVTYDYDHSRYEKREYTILPLMYLPSEKENWNGLQTFIQVKSTRYIGDRREEMYRYFISSLPLKNDIVIIKSIRQHWHIENRLHWKLDVAMQEDACRIHHPWAAENFSTLRKLVLQLLEKDKSVSNGIAFKQWKAALSLNYLEKLVGF
jgi:predicted transposase YbfD/YdcC